MDFDRWTLVLETRPDDAPEITEAEARDLQDAHMAWIAGLADQGLLVAAGPATLVGRQTLTDVEIRGVGLLTVAPEHAAELVGDDPAVLAGRLRPVLVEWTMPAGVATRGAGSFPRSVAEAQG